MQRTKILMQRMGFSVPEVLSHRTILCVRVCSAELPVFEKKKKVEEGIHQLFVVVVL